MAFSHFPQGTNMLSLDLQIICKSTLKHCCTLRTFLHSHPLAYGYIAKLAGRNLILFFDCYKQRVQAITFQVLPFSVCSTRWI